MIPRPELLLATCSSSGVLEKGGGDVIQKNAFDLYALVALDRQAIAYLPAVDCSNQTIALRVPGERYLQNGSMNREFQEASFRHALNRLGFET
jgi:hypothetical protein